MSKASWKAAWSSYLGAYSARINRNAVRAANLSCAALKGSESSVFSQFNTLRVPKTGQLSMFQRCCRHKHPLKIPGIMMSGWIRSWISSSKTVGWFTAEPGRDLARLKRKEIENWQGGVWPKRWAAGNGWMQGLFRIRQVGARTRRQRKRRVLIYLIWQEKSRGTCGNAVKYILQWG